MTFSTFHVRYFYNISTHILTRRMTKIGLIQLEKLIFQLTSSQGGWPSLQAQKIGEMYFNSHPHKEDDDLCSCIDWVSGRYFNSHPHKEDDTDSGSSLSSYYIISTHILTRRMTRKYGSGSYEHWYFNSHPHKEDDSNFKQKYSI